MIGIGVAGVGVTGVRATSKSLEGGQSTYQNLA